VRTELVRQLKGDEGIKESAYKDHLGYLTIGVGRLIDARKGGKLRPDEITYLLNNDIDDRIEALTRALPWFQDLDDARRGVLLNMAFQLGTEGLLQFRRTLDYIRLGKYEEAANAMGQSMWAKQTPVRAKRMADQMRDGKWRYAE
jgi:lysozyme